MIQIKNSNSFEIRDNQLDELALVTVEHETRKTKAHTDEDGLSLLTDSKLDVQSVLSNENSQLAKTGF